MKHHFNFFHNMTGKKVSLAAALTFLSVTNAMAFSEEQFHTAATQLASVTPISQQQKAENAVSAWLHQDYINSLQQAEIDATPTTNAAADLAALATFRQLLAQEPGNPLLLSYTGAATAKAAQYKTSREEKIQAVTSGMVMLERALKSVGSKAGTADTMTHNSQLAMHGAVPVSLEVRFVAANTFLALPSSLHQHAQGGKLLDGILNDEEFARSGIAFRGAVWMQAATQAAKQHRDLDAKHWLNQILEQQAPQTEKAKAMLQTL